MIIERKARIKNRNLAKVLYFFLTCVLLGALVYYIVGPSRGFFQSDCTDTIYWAQSTIDAGRVFNPDFSYAGLLPFGANLWYIPLIELTGMTMTSQLAGMVIFLFVFAGSIAFLMRSLGWSRPWRLIGLSAMLLILSSSDKLREIMWGHVIYYSLGMLLVCLCLGLAIRLLQRGAFLPKNVATSSQPRHAAALVALIVLMLGSALDGLQMLALCLIPVAGAIVAEVFMDPDARWQDHRTNQVVSISLILLCSTIVGLAILLWLKRGGINASYANGYSGYSTSTEWSKNLSLLIPGYLSLLGIHVEKDTSFGSIASFITVIQLAGSFILVACPILLLAHYRQIQERPTRLLLWAHLLNSAVILFAFIFGELSGANWRLTPFLGSSILVTIAALRHFWLTKQPANPVPRRLVALAAAVIILFSGINLVNLLHYPFDYEQDNALYTLNDVLQQEGLTYGYATFWRSQSLTLISNSTVKVRTIDLNQDGLKQRAYQSNINWYADQPGQANYFLLLDTGEAALLRKTTAWSNLEPNLVKSLNIEGFEILIFDDNIWSLIGNKSAEGLN